MNEEVKQCQNCKANFTIYEEDALFYSKLNVPAPSWCPFCRFVRRLTFINERALYKRNCAKCGLSVVTMYHPDTPITVWCMPCRMADTWDGGQYGREYDFSRPFFEQFKDLKYSVPHPSLDQNERVSTGCEYSNFCYTSKDMYLCFNAARSENMKYSKYVLQNNKNCLDSFIVEENDRGYELVQARRNYNCSFIVESDQCIDSHFLFDSFNCTDCVLSANIRNKRYVFKNEQLTKEAYQKAIADLRLDTYSGQVSAKKMFREIAKNAIHKYARIKNSVNAVGDFIENSKDIYHCYAVANVESMRYGFISVNTTKDCQDFFFIGRVEEGYEIISAGRGARRVMFSFTCGAGSQNVTYSDYCKNCKDCFGCVGLRNQQYCILNKQYTKEEYFEMLEKIKKHMDKMPYTDRIGRIYKFGEYFPTELSPFAYNETIAFEENPMTKEEILASGYSWRDMETKAHSATLETADIPESINDVTEAICKETIACPNNGDPKTQCISAFRILADELSF